MDSGDGQQTIKVDSEPIPNINYVSTNSSSDMPQTNSIDNPPGNTGDFHKRNQDNFCKTDHLTNCQIQLQYGGFQNVFQM